MMKDLRSQFMLRPDIHFLNFGSFGATPKPVFENYVAWQRLLESEPVQFIAFEAARYLAKARADLAAYINCPDPDDVVYVTNPSFAVNLIAKNLPFAPGDEVLTTDIEYGACDRTWDYHLGKKQAVYRRQKISLPIKDKESFIADFFAGLNNKTKAVFISHITSASGLILPVQEICAIAKEKGLITIVDGAHVPGHIPLDITILAADFYTGACHKWMMAPKGSTFLYAHKSVQPLLEPLVVSWGYKAVKPSHSVFLDYHQMLGTRDFSAFLTTEACIRFMTEHDWPSVSKACHQRVLNNAPRFYDLLGTDPICPLQPEWIGQMISIPIRTTDPEQLQLSLFRDHRIEVPIMRQGDGIYLRYSIQAFNRQEDLDALESALIKIRQAGKLLS